MGQIKVMPKCSAGPTDCNCSRPVFEESYWKIGPLASLLKHGWAGKNDRAGHGCRRGIGGLTENGEARRGEANVRDKTRQDI